METIEIVGTNKSPFVKFDAEVGLIEIKGRSAIENTIEFYKPLVEWISLYRSSPKASTEIKIYLEYFNTATSKCLTDLFKEIDALFKDGYQVNFNWYYEDEDILESGQDYQSFLKVPFNMVELEIAD
ncbi:MAG: nuclear pore complex subunit [Bacteroidetes bacterium RIFOXYA12_FULL_35_11]|nr:MAG: nuclear pore complex subunit [Bacteroidetes bacterium GWF2_35_48]OFY76794.1 MAG: nuclear pore complex subunit [Bacteroidetes bacterium RIFOXYA12_FULL_35_11]OFY94668.1 MAG: nuclear pore complex subunit [Bacteroidetes bacterium RIFOXYB2_FULL_35_7]OFY98022.1 MAG: nuclear pore complex subunit [Bacteroidetes bacterium RIFOXYC12_FULL_35_7]HBX49831.1 nuclear pore complex subunit [Bacteroidales bacterium]